MISSVAAARCWYSTRMKCCLASSREKTMILAGRPISPDESRRTSTLPSEPVPPVMRIRFPSRVSSWCHPFFVGSWILGQMLDQHGPRRRDVPCRLPEFVTPHAAVRDLSVVRHDFDVETDRHRATNTTDRTWRSARQPPGRGPQRVGWLRMMSATTSAIWFVVTPE